MEEKKTIAIGILCYSKVQKSAVYGITDMFITANRFAEEHQRKIPEFIVSYWEVEKEEIKSTFSSLAKESSKLDIVIIPSSIDLKAEETISTRIIEWIQKQYQSGSVISSVCIGAFILARTGLLMNRNATTHWALKNEFRELFPEVTLLIDHLIIDDNDIITAGGLMAWGDLCLHLIAKYGDIPTMLEVARFFLIDPKGREQQYYKSFIPYRAHGDTSILEVQQWLQRNYRESITSIAMAKKAKLTQRTFIRRFQKATTYKPIQYVQLLRIQEARKLLELTTLPFNQITWQVGYNDVSAFHKLFSEHVGLTPGEYKKRFMVGNKENN